MLQVVISTLVAGVVLFLVVHFFPGIQFRPLPSRLLTGQMAAAKPNWVSSLVPTTDSHYIAPLSAAVDLLALARCLEQHFPTVKIAFQDEQQMHVWRQSRWWHFTDWMVIWHHGAVAATATMGHSDFGQNRRWVEAIRQQCF